LTTLKLNKKSDDTQPKGSKAPLRRGSSAVRDRSVSAAKVMAPSNEKAAAPTIEKATQRNHRFDGKAHGSPYSEDAPAAVNSNTANSNTAKPAKPAGVDTRTAPRPDRNEP
jgi:23S rRNA pseudouridine2604 synthase